MGQPTQDIGITSSFVTPKYEQEDLSGTTINHPLVTQTNPMEGRTKHRKHNHVRHDYKGEQIHNNNLEVALEDMFPWLVRFNKIMCMAVGNKSYDVLDRLLLVYTQNVLKSIEESQKIPCKASKLKNHVNNTLTFFYFYWKDIKKPGDDHNLYLNKMSTLLGIFIDMELKLSKQDNNVSKITSKLLTMLWIYLDNSEEHILRVLLRIKSASKKSTKICNPIFKRCLVSLPTSKCVTDVAYVRYLLTFKIWQKMQVGDGEKENVNELALKKLGPCVPKMHPDLLKCISQPLANNKNETICLLESNSFNVERARETFLLLEERFTETATVRNSTGAKTSTVHKRTKVFSKQNTKEIIFIDLTKEETSNEVHDPRKAKKKNKRKLEALEIRRKKCKPQNSGIQVQVVHSTQNPKSTSTDTASRYLPISDNQVSESMDYSAKDFKEQPETSKDNCCKTCSKQDGIQHSRVAHLLKLLKLVIQIIKDSHVFSDLENLSKGENCVTSQTHLPSECEVKHSYTNTQDRKDSFSQEKSFVNTMPLFTTCQNCISQTQTMKREFVKKENYDAEGLYKDTFADLHKIECTLRNMACINKSSVYGIDVVQQKLPRNVNECVSCYKRIHAKPFSCHNQTVDYITESNKFTCDKTIVNKILSDLDECMNALNRIGQRIVSVYTEKQQTELSEDRSNECSISTTIFGDQDAALQTANTTQDFNSSITDKLQRILEICNKNEFLNIQEIRTLCGAGTSELTAATNNVESISKYEQQTIVSTSYPDLLRLKALDGQSEVNCSCSSNLHKSQEQQERRTAVTSTQTQFEDDFPQHDDFKTVDILADVLNGDMCMENEQDVLEDSQSSLISSISNENPIFNYLNDDNELSEISDSVKCMKPLPERSLGTTGILNSLLDFDLINMDSTLDDFMYSSIQTVNPRVIKKNLGKDTYATNKHGDDYEFEGEEQMLSFANENVVNLLPKEKGESCTNQNDPVGNSVDIVGFGLNSSKPEVFDLSALEDEETDIRNMPSSLCQSPLSINSDIVSSDIKDITSKYISVSPIHDLSSDISIERSYMYTKEDTMKDFQSFNDLTNKLSSKTCASKDVPMNLLTDCFAGEDSPSLSYNSISVSPVQFKECNWPLEQSLNTPNPLFSTAVNLASNADSAVLLYESQRTVETSECSSYTEKITDQRIEDQSHTAQKSAPGEVNSKTSNRKMKCDRRMKKENLQLSRVTKAKQEMDLEIPIIHSGSLDRKRIYSTRNTCRQLKHIDLEELGIPSSRKKQVVIDIDQEDPTSLFERNHDNAPRGLQKDSNIVYELSSQCDSQQSKKKYVKVTKRRVSAGNNAELSPIGSKCVQDVPSSILMKPKVRWFIRSVNPQTPLFVKKQKLKKVTDLTFSREEASTKKRESKFLSLSEKGVTSKNKSKHVVV